MLTNNFNSYIKTPYYERYDSYLYRLPKCISNIVKQYVNHKLSEEEIVNFLYISLQDIWYKKYDKSIRDIFPDCLSNIVKEYIHIDFNYNDENEPSFTTCNVEYALSTHCVDRIVIYSRAFNINNKLLYEKTIYKRKKDVISSLLNKM